MNLKSKLYKIWLAIWKKKNPFFDVEFDARIIDKNGKVVWSAKKLKAWWNGLMNEGEENVLDVYFRGQNAPTTFYLGLGNNGGTPQEPAETATLATITEVSGTGYSRQQIERNTTGFPTLQLDAGDYRIESKSVSFTNTGTNNWTSIDYVFLTDVSSGTSGKLLITSAMPNSKIISPGETFEITSFRIKAQ